MKSVINNTCPHHLPVADYCPHCEAARKHQKMPPLVPIQPGEEVFFIARKEGGTKFQPMRGRVLDLHPRIFARVDIGGKIRLVDTARLQRA